MIPFLGRIFHRHSKPALETPTMVRARQVEAEVAASEQRMRQTIRGLEAQDRISADPITRAVRGIPRQTAFKDGGR